MAELQSENIDYEKIEKYMGEYSGGEIYISKEYWEEGIAIIYLNHLERKNAISGKMIVDLRKCIQELENWKNGKAVLVTSLGENFCSGCDLNFARACGTPQDAFYMSALMGDALKRLRKLPLISFALIHGPTIGGGAEISTYCDQIIVTDNVKFGFVHGKMGIITAWGGTSRLVQLLGERKALDILLSAKIMNAEECLNIGLANAIVPTASKKDEALNYIKQKINHHHTVISSYKLATCKASEEQFEKSLLFERELFCKTWGAEPNKEALKMNIKHVKTKI